MNIPDISMNQSLANRDNKYPRHKGFTNGLKKVSHTLLNKIKRRTHKAPSIEELNKLFSSIQVRVGTNIVDAD